MLHYNHMKMAISLSVNLLNWIVDVFGINSIVIPKILFKMY